MKINRIIDLNRLIELLLTIKGTNKIILKLIFGVMQRKSPIFNFDKVT